MATYVFRCVEHGDIEHDDREPPICFCGERMARVYVPPYISANATPTSRTRAFEANQTEKRWVRDMAAYKRMRNQGLQPKGIDGAARLEARANTHTELAMGRLMSKAKVKEGAARSAEVLGHDVEV